MGISTTDKPAGSLGLASVLALGAALALAAPAAADTFKPTRFDDPPPNKCKPDDCSLREAVRAANNTVNKRDEVLLQKGTYKLTLPNDGTFGTLGSGDLDLFTPITLSGRGTGETRIQAKDIGRVISNGCGVGTIGLVTIERLTVRRGDPGDDPFNCTASGDRSLGGGIFSASDSRLKLNKVVIRGSEAVIGGGLFASAPKLTIKDSTITGNTATEGGGVQLSSKNPQAVTTIRSSTISGNTASKGGGILADGALFGGTDPSVQIVNSTVAGNQASADGGGIMADNLATVNLDNATVAHNMADSDNAGGGDAGGVFQHSSAVFGLLDSVIAGNTVGSSGGMGTQCVGEFGDSSGALIQAQTGLCTFTGSFSTTANPMIGPLADNGGPTQTVALLAGSPAIGLATTCPATDQRGVPRPDTDCDSGAFQTEGP